MGTAIAVAIVGGALAAAPAGAQAPCYQVSVFAGRGIGDGGPAARAIFNSPRNIIRDSAGDLFVADADNARVRKIDPNGTITTVAGNGAPGPGVDGAPAVQSSLKEPSGLALDSAGNLLIVDTGGHTVWKLTADGILHRVAGDGVATGSIDGDNPGGPGNDPTDDLNDGQLAGFATFNRPVRVAVDGSGNLLITDLGNNRLRKVDAASGRISTLFTAADGLSDPVGIAIGPAGEIYVANRGKNQILKIVGTTLSVFVNAAGAQGPAGDGGPAIDAQLNGAGDVAVDANGVVYIGDTESNWIRKVDTNGIISKVDGNGNFGYQDGPAFRTEFRRPGVAIGPNNTLIIADTDNNRIRMYDIAADNTTTIAGSDNSPGDGGAATAALLNRPTGLAVDTAGNVYITEHDSHRVRRVDPGGTITTVVNEMGVNDAPGPDGGSALDSPLAEPTGIALDAAGDLLIADAQTGINGGPSRVLLVDPSGILHFFAGNGTAGFSGDGGPAPAAMLNTPLRIAVGADGSVYIADFNNNRIRKVAGDGTISTFAGPENNAGLNQPSGLAFDGAGNLFVADFGNNRVVKIDANGGVSTVAGGGRAGSDGDGNAAGSAHFDGPTDVIVAGDGALLVVDQNNNKVRRIAPGGDGNIGPSGTITTVVGSGTPGYKDGPGDQANLLIPTDIEVDGHGNLLIADRGNQLVRLATPGTGCGTGGGGGGGSCQTSADCNDGNACTVDSCQADGTCRHDVIGSGDCAPHCAAEPDGCIPGGGPKRTDCLAELLVRAPLTMRKGKPAPVVRCVDGDPTCDFDDVSGQCTFRVAWCLNVPDARLGCTASGVAQQVVNGPAQSTILGALVRLAPQNASQTSGRAVTFSPPLTDADTCTDLTAVVVHRKGRKAGKMQIKASASTAGRPRRKDADKIRLLCVP